jgi:hypothetical protein
MGQRADSDRREPGLGDDLGGDPGGIVVVGRVLDTPSTSSRRPRSHSVSASWCEKARATDDFGNNSAVTVPEVLPPRSLMVITPSSCQRNGFEGSMMTAPANRLR